MSPRRSEPSAARATRDPGAPRRSLLTRLKTASLAAVAALAVLAALLPARVSAWPSQLPANVVPEIWGSFNGPAADFAWLDQETMIIAGRMGRMSLFRNGQKVSDLVDITSRITPMNGGASRRIRHGPKG